jgi:hypothetical protein
MVNFAGCSSCGSIVPLMCAGAFPPHMPTPVQTSAFGPYCPYCGPLPPVFTCSLCGTMQGLYVPGMPVPQVQRMGTPLVAPVLQAPQGASSGQLQSGLKKVAMEFLTAVAQQAGSNVGNQMYAWS